MGSTPFARMFMNNLQDINDKYDNLENSFVYKLYHSSYNNYSSYKYNIIGILNKLKLFINLISYIKIILK